jgi:hypothetical protein
VGGQVFGWIDGHFIILLDMDRDSSFP